MIKLNQLRCLLAWVCNILDRTQHYFFAKLELECEIRGISNQKQKYHLAVSKTPHKAMLGVKEIIICLITVLTYIYL